MSAARSKNHFQKVKYTVANINHSYTDKEKI